MAAQTSGQSEPVGIGIIGGSRLYRLLADAERVEVETPFGPPSAPVALGWFGGRRIAFLPRHGERHEFPAHRVNYRANVWALRSLGVRQVIAPCAVGSLQAALDPGSMVAPDQLVDRTSGRLDTYYDGVPVGAAGGAVHVGFADPYCPRLRVAIVGSGHGAVDGGTMVVISGPRFSTRAESRWHQAAGWSVVSMTGYPEAVLARELALCYATVAVVTDHDAGAVEGEGVDQATVFARFRDSLERLKRLLADVVAVLPDERPDCPCAHALDGITLPAGMVPNSPTP